MRRRFSGIRAKFIAIFLLIGLLPVLASGWFTIWQSEQGLIQVEATRLKTTVEDNGQLIDQWLHSRLAEMKELAALPESVNLDRGVLFLQLLDLTSDMPHYESIYFVSPTGEGAFGVEVQHGSARAASAVNVGDQPWFQRVMAGEDTFSEPIAQEDFLTGEIRYLIGISTPIYDDGQIVGAVVGNVWLDPVFERVSQIALGQIAQVYLLDSEGLPLTPVESISDPSVPVSTEAAQAILRGETGVEVYDDPAGVRVMGSYTFLPTLGWGIILEVEEGRAVASALQLGSHLRSGLLIFIIATIAVVVLAGMLASGFITRLVLTFAAPTRQIAQGDLTLPRLPVDRNDELGDMAKDFTKMVQTLPAPRWAR